MNKSLKYAIQEHKSKFDYILRQLKDTAKSNLSIQKIADIEALAIYTISIDSDIEKIVTWVEKKATEVNIEELMIKDNGASYSDILVKALNKDLQNYSMDNLKYGKYLKPWSQRYLNLLPPKQKINPPSFGEFYFKGASKKEVIITLKILQLIAIQETLEIQQKIITEK